MAGAVGRGVDEQDVQGLGQDAGWRVVGHKHRLATANGALDGLGSLEQLLKLLRKVVNVTALGFVDLRGEEGVGGVGVREDVK